jgi:hypothetical protein
VLHFSNAGPNFTEDSLARLFTTRSAPAPTDIKFFTFPAPAPGEVRKERRSGLMQFADERAATDALALCNNVFEDGYTVKLSFSGNPF